MKNYVVLVTEEGWYPTHVYGPTTEDKCAEWIRQQLIQREYGIPQDISTVSIDSLKFDRGYIFEDSSGYKILPLEKLNVGR